jgi:hypothetical protein
MVIFPGTIALGKFRILYEEEPQRSGVDHDRDLVQQRAIIRLNEDLVRVAEQGDYTVYCDDESFQAAGRQGPFAAAVLRRCHRLPHVQPIATASKKGRRFLDDAEMDLSMTYGLKGSFSIDHWARAAQGISYAFNIKPSHPSKRSFSSCRRPIRIVM